MYIQFFLFILIGTITTIIISTYHNNAYSRSQLQTYENEKYGIKTSISYGLGNSRIGKCYGGNRKIVCGFSSIENKMICCFFISLFSFTGKCKFTGFYGTKLKSIQTSTLKNETVKIQNQNSSATLGGQPTFKVIYKNSFTDPLGKIHTSKRMSIWTVLESKAYQFTFLTSSNDKQQYDQYIETPDRIIK